MLKNITDELISDVRTLSFSKPVDCVYNPLEYARKPWDEYCRRFGSSPKSVILAGLNPGPFGMAQVGVPFGEITAVRDWMGIELPVDKPTQEHPKRPITGFARKRSEVSGRRLWGWARERWGTPENFFSTFFVTNYCPLVFMEQSGKNLTPDKLAAKEKTALFKACDKALLNTVKYMQPDFVLGIGGFTTQRLQIILDGVDVTIGRVLHPSPANPAANRGWAEQVDKSFKKIGIAIPENK